MNPKEKISYKQTTSKLLPKNPTQNFQAQVRKAVNNSKTLFLPENKWKHINMKPTAPPIKGLIKIHKPEQPIRPVVNWRGAPAYKLALLFTQNIHKMAPLPNTYNLQNTRELVEIRETNLMSLALFLYLMLNMFQMLLNPSSGACDLCFEINATHVITQHISRKLLRMAVLTSETC